MKRMNPTWMTMVASLASTQVFASDIQIGHFIDAPVTGLYYETSSKLSGYTQQGQFEFKDGDEVRFYLGSTSQHKLLATVAAQEVVTPNLASTTPSKSLNMVRLLLGIDTEPNREDLINLDSEWLSSDKVQALLKALDLNNLPENLSVSDKPLASVQEAARHLESSQQYIEKNFTSKQILTAPVDVKLVNTILKRRDWRGNLCFYDTARRDEPNYHGPIGSTTYKIVDGGMILYPDVGDYYGSHDGSVSSCEVNVSQSYQEQEFEKINDYSDWGGLIACAHTGCTHQDLNGFDIEDFDDEGDWKYRTVAISYNTTTKLLTQKSQGLGKKAKVEHDNLTEHLWFTSAIDEKQQIDFQGYWRQRNLASGDTRCLYIAKERVLQSKRAVCTKNNQDYTQDVTAEFGDMWWLNSTGTNAASIEQLNSGVKWYSADNTPRYSMWEFLPTQKQWSDGKIYRRFQDIQVDQFGKQQARTTAVFELEKLPEDSWI